MSDHLIHHGIEGQKWGVRRFQNADGTRTAAGKRRERREDTLHTSFAERSDRRDAAMRKYYDENHQLTEAGKRRLRSRQKLTKKYGDVRQIVDSMSDKERAWLNDNGGPDPARHGVVASRTVIKNIGRLPVSYVDLYDTGQQAEVDIGTRAGDKYRGKGYATRAAKRGIRWYEKHKDDEGWSALYWNVYKDNVASQKLAEKLGFEKTNWEGDKIYQYVRN